MFPQVFKQNIRYFIYASVVKSFYADAMLFFLFGRDGSNFKILNCFLDFQHLSLEEKVRSHQVGTEIIFPNATDVSHLFDLFIQSGDSELRRASPCPNDGT